MIIELGIGLVIPARVCFWFELLAGRRPAAMGRPLSVDLRDRVMAERRGAPVPAILPIQSVRQGHSRLLWMIARLGLLGRHSAA